MDHATDAHLWMISSANIVSRVEQVTPGHAWSNGGRSPRGYVRPCRI